MALHWETSLYWGKGYQKLRIAISPTGEGAIDVSGRCRHRLSTTCKANWHGSSSFAFRSSLDEVEGLFLRDWYLLLVTTRASTGAHRGRTRSGRRLSPQSTLVTVSHSLRERHGHGRHGHIAVLVRRLGDVGAHHRG